MKKIAIIPARGGSKRIPKKNIKSFLGKPIIAYSIEAAINSGLFDKVMVSTDDTKIAEIAQSFGASVPFLRSSKNSDDYATAIQVLTEVIEAYQNRNQIFNYACCIFPTAPFVTATKLTDSFNLLIEKNYDTVFPVLKFSFPIQRAIKLDASNKMQMFQPEHMNTRSQDLTPAFHDSGQFYWFKPKTVLPQKKLWTDNTGCILIDEMEGQDIDSLEDWNLAELKYQLIHGAKNK